MEHPSFSKDAKRGVQKDVTVSLDEHTFLKGVARLKILLAEVICYVD